MNIQDASHELDKVLRGHFNKVDLLLRLELMDIIEKYGRAQYREGFSAGVEVYRQ